MHVERSITAKGQASRSRLLKAAAREFGAKGYINAKISDIVKAAGLTQAAFYLYFPSKEAVFSELVQHYREQLEKLANASKREIPQSTEEAARIVQENLQAVFSFLSSYPYLTRIALNESPDAEAIKDEIIQMIILNVQRYQEAGLLREGLAPEVAAECIVGMFERLSVKWLLTKEKDPQTLSKEMSDVILNGMFQPAVR